MDIDYFIASARDRFSDGHRLKLLNVVMKTERYRDSEERTASLTWDIIPMPLESFGENACADMNSIFKADTVMWEEEGWKCCAIRIYIYYFTKEDTELLQDLGRLKTVESKSYTTKLVCGS